MWGWSFDLYAYYSIKLISFVFFVLILLLCVALTTVWERKILGLIQRRKGPNVVGYCGVLQPFSDGLKLLLKESIVPTRANKYMFLFAPVLAMTLSFMLWAVLPVGVYIYEPDDVFLMWNYAGQTAEFYDLDDGILQPDYIFFRDIDVLYANTISVSEDNLFINSFNDFLNYMNEKDTKNNIYLGSILNTDIGLLMILSILSLNTYPVILGGWASNSKYAFLGALRASAQMISYEIAMSLTILPICVVSGSANMNDIIESQTYIWNILLLPLSFILFFICVLAETYRTPFDFTEAEGELVSGFNVEYSSMGFALFFLAEYLNIIFMCGFMSVLFLCFTVIVRMF